jgi:hypothetical protein
MKIREIKNKELRELAESRIDKEYLLYDEFLKNNELTDAFYWRKTKEGWEFWNSVNKGIITELPKEEENFKEIPNYYIGSKYKYEARKVIEEFQPDNYNVATAITYLLRAGKKKYVNNDFKESLKADIQKAINHLTFELERLK